MKSYLELLRVKEKELIESGQPPITGYDFCTECVLLQDNDFIQLAKYIKDNVNEIENDLIEQIKLECRQIVEYVRCILENRTLTDEEYVNSFLFYQCKIDRANVCFRINSVKEYIDEYNCEAINSFCSLSDSYKENHAKALSYENLKENSIYYRMSGVLLRKYNRDYQKNNFDYKSLMVSEEVKKKIESLYGHGSLCRYDLLKFNVKNHYIINSEPPYIIDTKYAGIYLTIDHKNKTLIDLFNELIKCGYIQDISFKIGSVKNKIVTLEEKMFGQKFSFNLKELPDLSRFYDTDVQEDNIWVTVVKKENKFSLTFEETSKEILYDSNLNIVTNLVHLEVTQNNGDDVISHIDHEYIVYNIDTYYKRLTEPKIKGEHKIKTFKIDNAKIPLNYRYQNVNVLFFIINASMNKKELVKEYFENIQ
ncbi:hypothetical protein RN616_11035 [Morganella morganii]|uniref:hypothetical protein n=1 Tax=Morganella morganii TaxID=582 RepID=UPI0028D7B1F3|nr:hypothetical protein [Morganella morganii]WNP29071.1 hypothetical protein RN616_11035 [Morganella morganii]